MELTATILITVGAVANLAGGIFLYRVIDFRPRHGENAAAAVARARQMQRVAMTCAAITVVCGATAAALNNGRTTTWVYGAVVLVAGAAEGFLIARARIPEAQDLRALGFDEGAGE
ncbi:hypothetical protein [Gordonia terrae]